jgi:hypothetical protein
MVQIKYLALVEEEHNITMLADTTLKIMAMEEMVAGSKMTEAAEQAEL